MRAWGSPLGFRVQSFGFAPRVLEFRALGSLLGFRVQSFGFAPGV